MTLTIEGTPLEGKTAVVTGASSGIGRATAIALSRAGARVGLVARREDRLKELQHELGDTALAVPADVTDYAAAAQAIATVEEHLGPVDILVNVAGVMLPAPIAEADPADWDRMVQVNLMGALYGTRAVLPGMQERGSGHIVNLTSTSGRTHQPNFAVYAASKHALGAFTNVLRKEVHPQRIRVTLFEPGPDRVRARRPRRPGLHGRPEGGDRGLGVPRGRGRRAGHLVDARRAGARERQRGAVPPHRPARLVSVRTSGWRCSRTARSRAAG